jgi:hypothetical protein
VINILNRLFKSIFTLFIIDSHSTFFEDSEQIHVSISEKEQNDLLSFSYTNRVKVFIIKNEWIEIEFLKESKGMVDISICDQNEKIIYSLSTFTVPTLHIIVWVDEWLSGDYNLFIKNEGIVLEALIIKEGYFM